MRLVRGWGNWSERFPLYLAQELVRQHHELELELEGNANCISRGSWCASMNLKNEN